MCSFLLDNVYRMAVPEHVSTIIIHIGPTGLAY